MPQPLTIRTEAGEEPLDLHEFEVKVRRGEISPQTWVRLTPITGSRFVPAEQLEIFRVLHEPKRVYFAQMFRFSQFPYLTSAVIFVMLAVYLLTARGEVMSLSEMLRFGAKADPLIADLGQLWRLLTANFLHKDVLHLGLNVFVLFNVGGALENTYRALDYLWLLVASGVSTMAASLWLTDAVSLGASGMVYGCLGALVVFGLKHRSILPARYRTILGEAAIPTLIGLFLIGVTSEGVDNWAHTGGLLAGLAMGFFMRPKLLADVERRWGVWLRAIPTASVGVFLIFSASLLGEHLPSLRYEQDDAFGITVPVPKTWRRGADRFGTVAWNNGLPETGRASFAAQALVMTDEVEAYQPAQSFERELKALPDTSPEILNVVVHPSTPARVGERDAIKMEARLEESFGASHVVAYFVPRGEVVYQLVFKYSEDFPQYERVVEQMQAGIRFEERKSLREARGLALLFPHSPSVLGRLGSALRREGEPSVAAEALRAAVRQAPSWVELRRELALALLASGEIEEACESSAAAVLYAPQDPQALEVDARCEVARGNPWRALERISSARALIPQDERLKAAETRLKATLEP